MIETISAVAFGIMCGLSLLGGTYVAYTVATAGWQAVGDKFDGLCDMVWHIDNVYEEQ